jgi:hypothetical protein
MRLKKVSFWVVLMHANKIPALRKLRQKNHESRTSQVYIVRPLSQKPKLFPNVIF